MCKINWEERFFEVAKDHYIRYKDIGLAFIDAQKFINSYREACEQANEEIAKEEKSKTQKDEGFESAWLLYRRKGSKKKALEQWSRLTDEERETAKGHIPAYIGSVSDVKYQKDFERYLRDKCFNDVVYKNNRIVYDAHEEKAIEKKKEDKFFINGVEYK
jgi:hypothetical protein